MSTSLYAVDINQELYFSSCYNRAVTVGGYALMRGRVVRTLLALLILMQSVSTLAMAPSFLAGTQMSDGVIMADSSHPMTAMSDHDSQAPCHGDVGAGAAGILKSCCETMDDVGCILVCSSVTSVVSCLSMLDSIDIHVRHPTDFAHAAPLKTLTELFRPPRII